MPLELPEGVFISETNMGPEYEKIGHNRYRVRARPCIHRTMMFVRKPCGAYTNKFMCSLFSCVVPVVQCVDCDQAVAPV